ncbi:MAG TPA: pectate lyase [Edaphobacter sp.]|nr:pectate lyase [Edaphobacter sp.]
MPNNFRFLLLSFFLVPSLHASVIGVSKPAEPITEARIQQLPAQDRAAWLAYLQRSQKQRQADQAALLAERKPGTPAPPIARESFAGRTMPLDKPAEWYATPEALHIADVIVSFQTPAGGWSKNLDMTGPARLPGESYTSDNLSKHPSPNDFDTPHDLHWNYVGTLDNDATTTEIRFLALVAAASPQHAATYHASILKGIHYLLAAQFPNGGWPQVWPLEGGYHDAITYNDNAVTEAAGLLTIISTGQQPYAFVPADLRHQAASASNHALQCILSSQVIIHGHRTIWAQQHDALTLQPTTARNYEPIALATGESAALLIYLMKIPDPSPQVVAAIEAGVAWLRHSAIYGQQWAGGRDTPEGRHLVPASGAGPLWSRYYSIQTEQPIFGDRDKTIHDTVSELSAERRNGYQWYGNGPQHALDAYAVWSKTHVSTTHASNGR